MKPHFCNRFRSAVLVAASSAMCLCTASAGILTWDGNGATEPNPGGGVGTWDSATTANWWNGAANVNWPALGGSDDDAVFGDSAGTVTVAAAGVTANELAFDTAGYIIQDGTITLNGTSPAITTAADVTATITSVLAGASFTKTGAGTLALGGNAFGGTVTVSQGRLQLNNTGSLAAGANVIIGDANSGETNPNVFFNNATPTFATLTVPGGVTGAAVYSNSWAQDITGETTLNSQFTVYRASGASVHGGFQHAGRITGSGAGSGNVSLTFDYTGGSGNFYWQANNTVANDFLGNLRAKGPGGIIVNIQGDSNAANNMIIPDTAMAIIDSGVTLRWNNFLNNHVNETFDGLAGAGTMSRNTGGGLMASLNLTINANNADNEGNRVFTGVLTGMTSSLILGGTGTQEFGGGGPNYTVGTNLNDGTLKLTNTGNWGSAVTFGTSNSPKLQLNAPDSVDSWTFNKQLNGGSANARVEKTGAGTVVLTPTADSSFAFGTTNPLTVAEGRLYLNGSFTNKPLVSVGGGATFGGKVPVAATTVAAGGGIEGGHAGSGTLTLDSLTFAGAGSVSGSPSAAAAPIQVTGALTTAGTGTVTVNLTGAPATNGTYHLIQFGSHVGAIADFQLANPSRSVFLKGNPGFIDLVVDTSNQPLWTGQGNKIWSTATQFPRNWKLSSSGTATDFLSQDMVTFDDSAATTEVNVDETDVDPLAMVFANVTKDYTLAGVMDITSGSITKTGAGMLTILSPFTFPGGATLAGGVVSISEETCLGTGNRTFNGGTLQFTGVNEIWTRDSIVGAAGGTIDLAEFATVTHAGGVTGPGTLTKKGLGTLVLSQSSGIIATPMAIQEGGLTLNYGGGNITYSGPITGSTGVLKMEGTGASATTGLTLTGTNTFTGETHIYGRRIFLDNPAGNAIGGNIVIRSAHWPYHDLSLKRDEQIADTAVLRFENSTGAYNFLLNGKTETLAGIESVGGAGQGDPGSPGNWAMISNAGYDGGNDNNIPAGKLIVAGTGTYAYYGQIRNQNGGSNNGPLSFEKAGTGTQLLSGNGITYTGATTVNGGILKLANNTTFASSAVTLNGGTFEVNTCTLGAGVAVTAKTGTVLAGHATTLNGTVTIEAGGFVAPGIDNGIGALTAATATLAGTYQCQIDGAAADRVNVTGALTVTDGSIALAVLGAPTEPEYIIATYGAGSSGLPAVTGVPTGYTVNTATEGVIKLVKSGGGYSDWAEANAPGQSMDQDHDNDGVSNGIEYFMGLSGSGFTANPAIATNGAISWPMGASYTGTYGTDYVIQTSPDLDIWTPVPQGNVTIDADSVDYTLPKTDPKKFARLKVTGP